MPLSALLDNHRVVLCVGSGGVGKTTTAAALSLAAARRGKRTLCLTIDPARRLAQSLGLPEFTIDAQLVGPERFLAAGLKVSGSLTVMMLNTKRTFDEIVERYASSPVARDRILNNRLYHYVSTALAGTQEFMAIEKLHELKNRTDLDLIVVDTPPTANALDFLDAPIRMIDALDSAAMRWFSLAFRSTTQFSINLLARSAALAMRGVGRLTGGRFLQEVAEFLAEINELFGGFRDRAREVQNTLRAQGVAYVLVTSPVPAAIAEALFFDQRLSTMGMRSDAFVVNRVHVRPSTVPDRTQLGKQLQDLGLALAPDAPERLLQALTDEIRQAEIDARHLAALDQRLTTKVNSPPRVLVPAFARDVHDLTALDMVARVLAH